MRIVFDLDNTLCDGPYDQCTPKMGAAAVLRSCKEQGYTVALYTARGMGSSAGNVGVATAKMGAITIEQLNSWGFVYDELHFGKPSADIYVDDKSIVDIDTLCYLLRIQMPEQKTIDPISSPLIEYRLGRLEAQAEKTNGALDRIQTMLSDYLLSNSKLEGRITVLEDKTENLETGLDKKSEAINDLRVGLVQQTVPGVAGGSVIVALVELGKYLMGHT